MVDELVTYQNEWECFCLDCEWMATRSTNPKFHSAKKHHRETGHTVMVSKISRWGYPSEEFKKPSKIKSR